MSLIRCLSNPEGLYVWHGLKGTTTFNANGMKTYFSIPTKLFETAIRRYLSSNDRFVTFSYMGISIDTDYINSDGKKMFGRIRLSYQGNEVIMWDVTWNYMIDKYRYEYYRKIQGKPNAHDIADAIRKLHIKNSSYIADYVGRLFYNYTMKKGK